MIVPQLVDTLKKKITELVTSKICYTVSVPVV